MARYVDLDMLIKEVKDNIHTYWTEAGGGYYLAEEAVKYSLETAPTVDAVEVKHGRWFGTHDGWEYSYSCSECGYEALTEAGTMHDQVCSAYCPNCGAKMDGGTE